MCPSLGCFLVTYNVYCYCSGVMPILYGQHPDLHWVWLSQVRLRRVNKSWLKASPLSLTFPLSLSAAMITGTMSFFKRKKQGSHHKGLRSSRIGLQLNWLLPSTTPLNNGEKDIKHNTETSLCPGRSLKITGATTSAVPRKQIIGKKT